MENQSFNGDSHAAYKWPNAVMPGMEGAFNHQTHTTVQEGPKDIR